MRYRLSNLATTFTGVACMAAAGWLWFAPQSLADGLRNTVRGLLVPGQICVYRSQAAVERWAERFSREPAPDGDSQKLREQLQSIEADNRRLRLQLAELQQEFSSNHTSAIPGNEQASAAPLLMPELVECRVLARERSGITPGGLLLDEGSAGRILEALPVLADDGPIVDVGDEVSLNADDAVFAGRTVVGKIAAVGRWASSVRLVTDAAYRGRAQLLRETSTGVVFGAEGVLEGRGEKLCRLTFIDAEQPVRVGDGVYSAEQSTAIESRMYYGNVVRAELKPGALTWDIWVEPAIDASQLRHVQVLRSQWNPLRVVAN